MDAFQNNLKFIFRALRNRNYRLFFGGQSISLIGTWMQQIAMSWLIYRLTNSPLLLGTVGFFSQIPTFLLTPFAGVCADRYPRHRIILIAQTLSMLQAAVLALLVLTNHIQVWHIFGLSLVLGIVNAFDIPARHSFTVEMIENKADLSNAIALNSTMFNLARLIGPSVAGVLISLVGEGTCFLLNAISYLAVIVSLCAMRLARRPIKPPEKRVWQELKDGFAYAYNLKPIRIILIILGASSLLGVPYQILMPVFAKEIFHGGPEILGYLMSMAGFGALLGALYLASRPSVVGLIRICAAMSLLFGSAILIFSQSRILTLSMAMIFVSGFAIMVQMAASNTVLQTIVDEDKRGRIMSLFAMAFMGMAPFGSLLAGALAHKIGAPHTVALCGLLCLAASGFFFQQLPSIRKIIRPIYLHKGIIPNL
ncbi:MAG: MFS transporter [Candidatus Omnitrophica bacterium]|nr:MFS transporter [Candidatus Omnitrophota bacterium]